MYRPIKMTKMAKTESFLQTIHLILTGYAEGALMSMEHLLAALITVESSGNNEKACNGKLGCLQISPVVVEQVNRHYGTSFKETDALNRYKAKEIVEKYIRMTALPERIGRIPTDEDKARIWKGGLKGYKRQDTKPYWKKVNRELKKLKYIALVGN